MKRSRIRPFGVAMLLTLMMLGTLTIVVQADLYPRTTILVRPGEGATFYAGGDGSEPPPHILIFDKAGNLRLADPNRNH